ncbi:hypothetical protein DFH09DRAFT_1106053 [Mycena vulgaris]|nr:hypothetical protein DFH09DRAFT_1106053 [Mycena vulgaris]
MPNGLLWVSPESLDLKFNPHLTWVGEAETMRCGRDPQIFEILSTPHFSGQIASLRRLSVERQYSMQLISDAAHTVEHVRFECTQFKMSQFAIPFPAPPSLISVKIILAVWKYTAPWVIDTISRILASNSEPATTTLEEVVISYLATPPERWDCSEAAYIAVLST